jgi:hypothetical protein
LKKILRVLGIRGIPAAHGGFESFAQALAPYLVERGWEVIVYCQEEGSSPVRTDDWQGVRRVIISVSQPGNLGTMVFDWRAIAHAAAHRDLCLTLGYNTAVLCARLRLAGICNVINMDGIEWRRAKWGFGARTWLWLNERAGGWLGDHLVADHPAIKAHLQQHVRADRITTIPYGSETIDKDDGESLVRLGLESGRFITVIARPEPENSILDIVTAFSARHRGLKLVVLGKYDDSKPYHAQVRKVASEEVLFLGAIYEKLVVQQLRAHSLAYIHGHQVGGTNPSLVEALGAHNPVFAHDNIFNRWVAGPGASYFGSVDQLDLSLTAALTEPDRLGAMAAASAAQHRAHFTTEAVLSAYCALLERLVPVPAAEAEHSR